MSEPFLDRLTSFTPDPGRLNRDELLFAAGRSSARSARSWKTVASVLTATQALTLVLLWPGPRPLPSGLPVAGDPVPAAAIEPPATLKSVSRELWSVRDNPPESNREDRPPGELTLIESGPALRAFASLPRSLLN